MIILLVLFIIIILLLLKNKSKIENYSPVLISENTNTGILKLSRVRNNIKLDKYNRIENNNYSPPNPEIGESNCYKVHCPYWISNVNCWQCR